MNRFVLYLAIAAAIYGAFEYGRSMGSVTVSYHLDEYRYDVHRVPANTYDFFVNPDNLSISYKLRSLPRCDWKRYSVVVNYDGIGHVESASQYTKAGDPTPCRF
jgi:hypothetical protein